MNDMRKLINLMESAIQEADTLNENMSDWLATGADEAVVKKLLQRYSFKNTGNFEKVKRPKASEVSRGDLFIGNSESGTVIIFKKVNDNWGDTMYIRVDKSDIRAHDSIQRAFKGVKGPYHKLTKPGVFSDRNRKTRGGKSVDQVKKDLGQDNIQGSYILGYMNEKMLPRIKPKLDAMIDDIYAGLRKLPKDQDKRGNYANPNKSYSSYWDRKSMRVEATEIVGALEALSDKGFTSETVNDYLSANGKLSYGYASIPNNEEEFMKLMKEPLAVQKFAKMLLDQAKRLHDQVKEMQHVASGADAAEKKLRGE